MNRIKIMAMSVFFLALNLSAADLPSWLEDWKVGGDFRVRGESIDFDEANQKDRSRARFRLRLGADKKINDQLAFKMRLASGSGDPTSTNQTFDSSFSGKDIVIDRAFLVYKKDDLLAGAGKVANPYHTTDMVWDSDVNPEGAYGQYKPGNFYVTLGGYVVEESSSGDDINLGAVQFGGKTSGDDFGFNGSVAYYLYDGPSEYSFVDVLGAFTFGSEIPFSLKLNVVSNTTSEVDDEDLAYAAYFTFGKTKKKGDWAGMVKYAEIQVNSVFGPLADSDFGFTDKEGFQAEVQYQSSKKGTFRASVMFVDGILDEDSGFNRIQLDYQVKF